MLPETLSSLITVLPMPVVIVGPNERVAEVNEAAIRLFGNDGRGMHYILHFASPRSSMQSNRRYGMGR